MSESNKLPNALVIAPIEEVAGRMVNIIRELKPDVVSPTMPVEDTVTLTISPHIMRRLKLSMPLLTRHNILKLGRCSSLRKLYFGVRPRGVTKVAVNLMPLFGQDPHHFGRNKDIDLTRMIGVEYPVHAAIRLSKQAIEIRNKAAACHASQGGGQPRTGLFRILRIIENLPGQRDYFMRAYPTPTGRHREKDLFEGLA